ncbi:DNA alkylation repair protein [Paludicola sp. MB14-C6]|uniref:DNA alkylation repair protein n=1 Tax=Paludihabitans sp. MB14-C6 TaxID=3070656 RepID=UPI0027DAFCF9|nr:DNA alkylation repair protein [Paludicola sp. MB14-C6]WMJ23835.1 DNA alkylation repair protein [Paludicola sp. MB14-C6]
MNFTLKTWTQSDYDNLLLYIHELADKKYQIFNQRLLPNVNNVIGVRMPLLQKIAIQIVKGNWKEYLTYVNDQYYEETMLKGLVITKVKIDLLEHFELIAEFVPCINNWAVCDSFCAGLKIAKEYPDKVFDFIKPYLLSDNEYNIRFAVVLILFYYINDEYIDTILSLMENIHQDGYYVKMAVAWCISMCYVKYEEKTISFLKHSSLDDFTYNRALQKISESNQVSRDKKAEIRKMKQT